MPRPLFPSFLSVYALNAACHFVLYVSSSLSQDRSPDLVQPAARTTRSPSTNISPLSYLLYELNVF